jgi:hypothetical protein
MWWYFEGLVSDSVRVNPVLSFLTQSSTLKLSSAARSRLEQMGDW